MEPGFIAGVGFALAWLKKWHGLGTEIEELYRHAGFTYREYEKVCDEYDLPEIAQIAAAEKQRSRRKTTRNTRSPKLPPCDVCGVMPIERLWEKAEYKFCPYCGRQLRASA